MGIETETWTRYSWNIEVEEENYYIFSILGNILAEIY